MGDLIDYDASNGRVKFGPGPTQDMPREWAESILTDLARTQPAKFGRMIAKAALEARSS